MLMRDTIGDVVVSVIDVVNAGRSRQQCRYTRNGRGRIHAKTNLSGWEGTELSGFRSVSSSHHNDLEPPASEVPLSFFPKQTSRQQHRRQQQQRQMSVPQVHVKFVMVVSNNAA